MKRLVLLLSFAMIFGVFVANAQDQKPATPAKTEAAAKKPADKKEVKKKAPAKKAPAKKAAPAKKEATAPAPAK
jgi:hypothetical protein